jgi:RimJ/RimL family protein N-acetyltransferase
LPPYRGKGLATEAAIFFKEYAFDKGVTNSLVSMIHIDNLRSQRVAEKNGMYRERQLEYRNLPIYIYRTDKTN